MVVSTNSEAQLPDFQTLLETSLGRLQAAAREDQGRFLSMSSSGLEQDVYDVMKESARGTPFESSIKLIIGLKFPDIVAKGYYGVEVKSSKKNDWRTTGNSVLEGTRVDGVERIFILFGKLFRPVEFKYRKYEECLPEVVVTHSPRYLIDMNTQSGKTIFDKISIPYDNLRDMPNPIRPILDFYRRHLKPGEDVWWLETGEPEIPAGSFVVRLWSNLQQAEKEGLLNQAMALFPEIFGTSGKKYAKLATWLAARHGIVSPSLRDSFTAGGQETIRVSGTTYRRVPKIFKHLSDKAKAVAYHVQTADPADLSHYWNIDVSGLDTDQRINKWIALVRRHSRENLAHTALDVAKLVKERLGR